MLFHNVLCVFFLAILAPKIETNAELKALSGRPETIFADVIRNISRVNTELEDLINNYEQFKKIHSSQEKFDEKEINYVSDPEGGGVNRNKKNIGNNRVSSGTTLNHETKMIPMEDETEKSSQSETNSEEESNSQSENSSESEKSSQSEHNNEENQRKEEPKWSKGNTNKKMRELQKATTKANIVKEPTFERDTENQENIDIHNSINTNKQPETIKHINETRKIREKQMQASYSESDSYSENEQVKEDEQGASKHKNRATANDTTAKMTGDFFSKNGTDVSSTAKKLLYSQTSLIFIQDGKDTDATLKEFMNFSSLPRSVSPELSDNDVGLIKDVFKTNILREAYGDACLKVVIRKCYKACQSVLTISCRALKCKSDLKSYFITTSKTVCIEAFNSSMAKKEAEDTLRRDATLNNGALIQYGYLSMACQSETEMPLRRKLMNDTLGNPAGQVNILRDKFERACQRISRKKCQKACKKAREATCEKFECQKRLKKNFKRNCKLNCKKAYSTSKPSRDSNSDDDSDDDSDDNSDDEYDGDYESS